MYKNKKNYISVNTPLSADFELFCKMQLSRESNASHHEISPRILFALADRGIGNNQNGALLHEGSFSFVLSLVTISQKFLYENNTNNLLQIESL